MTTVAPASAAHGSFRHVRARLIKAHLGLISIGKNEPCTQQDETPDCVDDKEPQGRPVQCQTESDLYDAQERDQSPYPLMKLCDVSTLTPNVGRTHHQFERYLVPFFAFLRSMDHASSKSLNQNHRVYRDTDSMVWVGERSFQTHSLKPKNEECGRQEHGTDL